MDRQIATRQIERIVHAIEGEKFPTKVRELLVFGSHGRGALNPGDLDVIVIHDPVPELLKRLEADLVKKYGKDPFYWPRGQSPERKFGSMMRKVMSRPGEKMDILRMTLCSTPRSRAEPPGQPAPVGSLARAAVSVRPGFFRDRLREVQRPVVLTGPLLF